MSRWQKIGKYVTIRNYTVFHYWNNKVSYFDSERKVPAYIEKAIKEFNV